MAYAETAILIALVREAAHPLIGDKEDYDPLMAMIGDAPLVLLGEASHGTHEFYRERAQITKRLINEPGRWNHSSELFNGTQAKCRNFPVGHLTT